MGCFYKVLVLETMDRCWDATNTIDKGRATKLVDWHDGGVTQQTTKVNIVAYLHSHYRNNTNCSRLLVDHTEGSLVGNDA